MKREDKELLFKDLSARVPYGTKIQAGEFKETLTDAVKWGEGARVNEHKLETIRPYLRSLSSMTEDEEAEAENLGITWVLRDRFNGLDFTQEKIFNGFNGTGTEQMKALDWLNAHHFDYRGLIPMRLAIEVTKENNPYV